MYRLWPIYKHFSCLILLLHASECLNLISLSLKYAKYKSNISSTFLVDWKIPRKVHANSYLFKPYLSMLIDYFKNPLVAFKPVKWNMNVSLFSFWKHRYYLHDENSKQRNFLEKFFFQQFLLNTLEFNRITIFVMEKQNKRNKNKTTKKSKTK